MNPPRPISPIDQSGNEEMVRRLKANLEDAYVCE